MPKRLTAPRIVAQTYTDKEVEFCPPTEWQGKPSKRIMGNYDDQPAELGARKLRPYEAFVYEL